MKRREFILGSSAALLSASASPAQEPGPFSVPGVRYRDEAEFVRCGTPTPSLPVQRRIAEQEARFQRLNPDAAERIKALISVHFHVIHDGDVGRIPESMIDDQIDVLNDAYFRRRNNIVFEKASVDYTDNASWFVLGFGTPEEREAKTNLVIESDRSLNFYTASPTDPTDPTDVLLGFATLPWNLAGDPDLDGVVVLFDSLPGGAAAPYNLGDTGTHEVGHWLGLFHTYEGGVSLRAIASATPRSRLSRLLAAPSGATLAIRAAKIRLGISWTTRTTAAWISSLPSNTNECSSSLASIGQIFWNLPWRSRCDW